MGEKSPYRVDDSLAVLELLFKQFYSVLAAYCNKYVKDSEVARDMIQDIFLKVWENRSTIDFSRPLHAYLLKSAHNQCMDYLQRVKVEKEYLQHALTEMETQYDHLFEEIAANDMQERIEQVVENLPSQCRIIFRKSRFEGMSHQAIADELNISVRTVETQIYRALKTLKNNLKKTGFIV